MIVTLITPNYPPTICGVGDHTFHLAQVLLKADMEVHIICSINQKTESVDAPKIYPVIEKWNSDGFKMAAQILENSQPDWVIVQYVPHGFEPRGLPVSILNFYAFLSKKNYNVLTIFHEVSVRPIGFQARFISAIETYIARKITQKSTKTATSIDFYADLLSRPSVMTMKASRGGKKNLAVSIIPIASNIPPIDTPLTVKNALKKRFDMPPNVPVIVSFGNRNISIYLDMFDQFAQESTPFIWLLCGKISLPTPLLENRSYLRCTGKMAASDIYQALSLGDIAFLPEPVNAQMAGGSSNKSGALATVLSLGIPVIGIKGDLNNALLRHEQNIYLINMNEKNALLNALKKCLNTEGVSQTLGLGARDLYEKSLTWEVVGPQYLSLINTDFSPKTTLSSRV
jgi:glycosyltransferase involved in cell wall biosynthesis